MEPYQSLFDFLGKPAGSELGKKVAEEATKLKISNRKKFIETKNYTGDILMYPESFLKDYFKQNEPTPTKTNIVEDINNYDLPF